MRRDAHWLCLGPIRRPCRPPTGLSRPLAGLLLFLPLVLATNSLGGRPAPLAGSAGVTETPQRGVSRCAIGTAARAFAFLLSSFHDSES